VNHFEEEFKEGEKYKPTLQQTREPKYKGSRSLTHKWKDMDFSQNGRDPAHTGYNKEKLINIAKASVEIPSHVSPH
jgi:hypothetical protein